MRGLIPLKAKPLSQPILMLTWILSTHLTPTIWTWQPWQAQWLWRQSIGWWCGAQGAAWWCARWVIQLEPRWHSALAWVTSHFHWIHQRSWRTNLKNDPILDNVQEQLQSPPTAFPHINDDLHMPWNILEYCQWPPGIIWWCLLVHQMTVSWCTDIDFMIRWNGNLMHWLG